MTVVPGPDKKPEVTDELLAGINPDWEVAQTKYQRSGWRYSSLQMSVEIESRRNLTEDPQQISDRVLKRAAEFYKYLETDNG